MSVLALLFALVAQPSVVPSETVQKPPERLGGSSSFYEGGRLVARGPRSIYENHEFVVAEEAGAPLPRWYEFLRLGNWEYRYPNGHVRARFSYDVGWYTQCCTGGPCEWPYEFRVGAFEAWWPDGKPLAKGTFEIRWEHIDTNCAGGDSRKVGLIGADAQFWNEDGSPATRAVLEKARLDLERL